MKKYIFFSLLAFICACQQNKIVSQTKYHDDGRAKPIIAICPITDSSDSSFYWSLPDEFYFQLSSNIKKDNQLYLTPANQVFVPGIQPSHLFYEQNWRSKEKYPFEYVCLLEIIEHSFTARDTSKKEKRSSQDLDITVRIKVIDLRKSDRPSVILQEIIHQRNFLPWQFSFINYEKVNWEKTSFYFTPLGMAHKRMTKTLVKRIEEYILLSQVAYAH
ncbi:MAG: hypothetical protein HY860_05860 [Chlamydiales bacterium]|nr:hypothetical protein [Chlamydiales bacterium]